MTTEIGTRRTGTGGLRAGEPAYDLVRNRPVVVADFVGQFGLVDNALQEVVADAYGNEFVTLDANTGLFNVVYLNLRNAPSKAYALPETRLARPRVERCDDAGGWTGREFAELEYTAELFESARELGYKNEFAEIVESIRDDSFSSAALDRHVRDGGTREQHD